jgi:nuclear pore complex protein Nup160
MAGIEEGFLVSAPLSPLYALPPASIPIPTARKLLPLPPTPSDADVHPEHATFSTLLTTSTHGTIALRLLHGGLIAELASLSYRVPSLRLVFPAPILPGVGLFLVDSEVLHVVVVTASASLYRLLLNLDSRNLWKNTSDIAWPREHRIVNYPENEKLLVHVEGTHSVTIALPNSSILRLEANLMKDDEYASA